MAKVVDKKLMGKPNEKFWVSYIKQRIRKNKNFLGFISGQTGSGKSYSSLRIGEEVDPDFNIDRCVFGGLELMNLINSGKLKRGSAICFEEVGVEMNSKNWASVTNKMINYLFQTFRHKGFILIMNSPYMDFVDSATRKLFHAEMQTTGIDFEKQEVLLKPQLIQYNPRLKKFYYKRLKVITAEGKVPVNIWRVAKPSEELRQAYEKKKTEYTDRLNKNIQQELEAVEQKQKSKRKTKDLTDIQQEVLDLLKQGLNVEQIALTRDRAKGVIFENIRLIKNKGYRVKPVYEDGKLIRYNIEEPERE